MPRRLRYQSKEIFLIFIGKEIERGWGKRNPTKFENIQCKYYLVYLLNNKSFDDGKETFNSLT